jgi:hypothetical protein
LVPTSGTVGSTVVLTVTSTSFPLDGDYQVQWSSSAAFDEKNIQILAKGSNARTDYNITASFTIPEAKYGTNYIRLIRYGTDDLLTYQFEVKPKLEVIPPQGAPGTVVKVKGTGFPLDGEGTVTFDGKATDIKVAPGANGTFIADFTMPATLAGDHKFVANAPKVITDVMTAMVKVVPVITMEPKQPQIGSEVKITGAGFAAKSVVKLKYDNANIANSPTTGEDGNFIFTFKVPESSTKDHKVTAEDAVGNSGVWSLSLEGKAPPKPAPLSPKHERFGWLGDQSVTFTWQSVTDVSGVIYTVEVGDDLNFFPLKPGMKKAGLTQPNCTLTIKPGTYYWRIRATDGAGNESEWSISPFPFSVGFFSIWILVIGGIVLLVVFVLLIRAFVARLKGYSDK